MRSYSTYLGRIKFLVKFLVKNTSCAGSARRQRRRCGVFRSENGNCCGAVTPAPRGVIRFGAKRGRVPLHVCSRGPRGTAIVLRASARLVQCRRTKAMALWARALSRGLGGRLAVKDQTKSRSEPATHRPYCAMRCSGKARLFLPSLDSTHSTTVVLNLN